jgi:hypothetical protein
VRSCVAGDRGGAIATLGDLTVIGSTLDNCTGVCERSLIICLLCLSLCAATASITAATAATVAKLLVVKHMLSMMSCHALHSVCTDHAAQQ